MCEGWIRLVVEVYVYVRGDCIWHVRVRCDVRRCVIFLRFTFFTEPHASSKTRHNSQTAHSSATLPRIENNNSRQQLNENHKKSNLTARSAAHGHTSLLISHGGAIPCCCCFARFAFAFACPVLTPSPSHRREGRPGRPSPAAPSPRSPCCRRRGSTPPPSLHHSGWRKRKRRQRSLHSSSRPHGRMQCNGRRGRCRCARRGRIARSDECAIACVYGGKGAHASERERDSKQEPVCA